MRSPAHQDLLEQDTALCALERYSFSDEAARFIQRDAAGMTVQNVPSIADVFKAMNAKGVHGLIPIENASGGLVIPHLDLLAQRKISIVGDIRYKIRMCMGGKPGAKDQPVVGAYSHGKGLEQCTKLLTSLAEKTPNLQQKAFPTTVDAVRHVASLNEPGHVALASRGAIENNGLEVYEADVANHPGDKNRTKFYICRQNGEHTQPDPEATNHALILQPHNTLGILQRVLSMIANARVNLTSIHSRNTDLEEYAFFLEMEKRGSAKQFALLAEQLAEDEDVQSIQWLGSWDKRFEN